MIPSFLWEQHVGAVKARQLTHVFVWRDEAALWVVGGGGLHCAMGRSSRLLVKSDDYGVGVDQTLHMMNSPRSDPAPRDVGWMPWGQLGVLWMLSVVKCWLLLLLVLLLL